MGLYQATIFGECREVIKKDNPEKKPKKLSKKNQIFKQKLEKLYNIYDKLYEMQNISILEQREVIVKKNLVIYPDERQAEPIESIKLDIENNIDKKLEIAEQTYERLQFESMKEFKYDNNNNFNSDSLHDYYTILQ